MATFVIYSHTDNKDIWPLLSEKIKLIDDKYSRYIAINDSSYIIEGFNKTIRYNDALMYDNKLLQILENITTPYVVLIHDNDILINFNNELFDKLLQKCIENNIDRCIFGVVASDSVEKVCICDDDFIGCINKTISPHFNLPYDVSPSIWKVESFRNALLTIPNTSYRDIEQSYIGTYCNNNLKMYGFIKNSKKKSVYVIGRPFYYDFQFLHIFIKRQLLESPLYMDQEDNYKNIIEKYPDIKLRGIIMGQGQYINIHFRSV